MSKRKQAAHKRRLRVPVMRDALQIVEPSEPLYTTVSTLVEHTTDPLRRAILARFLRAAQTAVSHATPATLTKAASAESDVAAVVATLEALVPGSGDASDEDVITGAQLRGLEAREQVLQDEGGTLSVEQLARRLQLTRQAVDLRRRNHRLIGLPVGRHGYRYPVWQLGPHGIWPWVPAVIQALAPHDAWQQIFFLLSPHPDLGGQTPLQVLRSGRTDDVLALARTYASYGLG
jgi:hypothetical protein